MGTPYIVKHADGSEVQIPVTLPCPFCGSPLSHVGPESALTYEVRCLDCGARTKAFSLPDESEKALDRLEQELIQQAVKAWNRRM